MFARCKSIRPLPSLIDMKRFTTAVLLSLIISDWMILNGQTCYGGDAIRDLTEMDRERGCELYARVWKSMEWPGAD